MKKNHYIALLRGINVGGNNIIKMVALKACFEEIGFTDVRTYIQSGNVIFTSTEKSTEKLTKKIEKQLSKTFNYKSVVVVISEKQLKEVIEQAPKGFGQKKDEYRYDVIFIKPPLSASDAFKQTIEGIKPKEGIDEGFSGKHALYFSRPIAKATQSRLSKIVALPIYQSMTIRNWNTTTKLCGIMEEDEVVKSVLKASKEVGLKGNLDKLGKFKK